MESIIEMFKAATPLQFVTYVTFMITFMGMGAGSYFFAMERSSAPDRFREGISVTSLILAIAAINYYLMSQIYVDSIIGKTAVFPTVFRYVDWFLTTPLMLLKFPLLLGLGAKGRTFLVKLIVLDLGMIGFSFAGELQSAMELHFAFFAIACLCWGTIVYLLNGALQHLPDWITPPSRMCVTLMGKFIFFGWMIYPVGYLFPSFIPLPEIRELLYNIGDLVNKLGLGLVVFVCAIMERNHAQAPAPVEDEFSDVGE